MDIKEAIINRHSVRSYSDRHLTPETISALNDIIAESSSPFGGNVTIRLKSFDIDVFKPGTYGVIKGASNYFLIGAANDKHSSLSVGYRFEHVVLSACMNGLGTCWMGATFKNTDFAAEEVWPEGEKLIIVSPVGFPAKPRFIEKLTKAALRSTKRKDFASMFFYENFKTPAELSNQFGKALEMMRLAPSSTNSQPWRALVRDESVIFYYKPESRFSIIDCGIGLYHFHAIEKLYGHEGHFIEENDTPAAPENWIYLISYYR